MAPESRPRTASEREDEPQLVNCLTTGLLAGGEKESSDQVDNELDQQMAVDTLHEDVNKFAMQDSEQQARGKRSIPHFSEHETRYSIFATGLSSLVEETLPFLAEPLADLPPELPREQHNSPSVHHGLAPGDHGQGV